MSFLITEALIVVEVYDFPVGIELDSNFMQLSNLIL